MVLLFTASAIKCWQCSSHVSFCDDTFNANNVTEQQKGWAYKECILTDSQPNLNNQRAVCKKLKQIGKLNEISNLWSGILKFGRVQNFVIS